MNKNRFKKQHLYYTLMLKIHVKTFNITLNQAAILAVFYSPACLMPSISSSFSLRPIPRSISLLPRQALNGVDTHAAHHFLDFVVPRLHKVDKALVATSGFRRLTSSGRCVAIPQLHLPEWQSRQRWQPSAKSAPVPI